ncbi:hypothetical protein FRC00_002545 [Tulasnella sp. 408]|nr:hypothetical protein FRC00_002545 [Tulasnella sp. 408]
MTVSLNGQSSTVKKSLYEGSTQFRHWRFSSTSLAKLRASQNEDSVSKIRHAFEDDSVSTSCFLFTPATLTVNMKPGSSSTIQFLSAEEEYFLVKLYISKISQLCAHFRFPEEVEATAVSYLKRFYLRNTVMDYHPKNTLSGFNQATADDEYAQALERVRASRMTDAELIFTPSQIALACLHSVSPDLAEQWANIKSPNSADAVMETVSRIQEIIDTQSAPPDLAMVKEIDKRLKICTNPEKVVGSKAYMAKQAEIEAEAARKRAKKAEGLRANMERDPFADDTPGVTIVPTEPQSAALNPTRDHNMR